MIVVDSSVWIDLFNGRDSAARGALRRLLDEGHLPLAVPDLVLYEVLRGFRDERELLRARALMQPLHVVACGGEALAVAAASHYRGLRARGVTVRRAIDVLIDAFCIQHDCVLLHSDRDFDALAQWCGLRVWGAAH